jgi:hypothetical protein
VADRIHTNINFVNEEAFLVLLSDFSCDKPYSDIRCEAKKSLSTLNNFCNRKVILV